MATDDQAQTPLHPIAQKVLKAVEAKEPGHESAIPAPTLKSIEESLRGKKSDKRIFEHLAVLFVRLRDKGLKKAAAQLMELAKIGLNRTQLSETVAKIEAGQKASGALKPEKRTRMTGALKDAKKAAQSLGFGLRGKKR